MTPLVWLRRAGLLVVLVGDSFRLIGLASLPPERRENCKRYSKTHKREILAELREEDSAWRVLWWFHGTGLDLSLNEAGQVVWSVRQGFERLWEVRPGVLPTRSPRALPADCEWQCWRFACQHHREILAELQPCKGWKPTGPGGGCATLEEFKRELEKEAKRGVLRYCPFHEMWICRKDCPKWCGRWNEPLTDGERAYWAALWPDEKQNVV